MAGLDNFLAKVSEEVRRQAEEKHNYLRLGHPREGVGVQISHRTRNTLFSFHNQLS